MASPRRDPKSGRFSKQPATRSWYKHKSIFYPLLVLFVVAVVLSYGILTEKDVQLSLPGWLSFLKVTKPNKGNTSLPVLANPTEQQTAWKELYDEEVRKNRELERTIQDIRRQFQQYRQSVWYCCSVIAGELSQTLSIDANLHSEDNHTKEVYRCVQRCLNAIGYYDGIIDGDQGRTKAALEGFQRAMNLTVDGKLGRQTWNTMIVVLGQKILEQFTVDY